MENYPPQNETHRMRSSEVDAAREKLQIEHAALTPEQQQKCELYVRKHGQPINGTIIDNPDRSGLKFGSDTAPFYDKGTFGLPADLFAEEAAHAMIRLEQMLGNPE